MPVRGSLRARGKHCRSDACAEAWRGVGPPPPPLRSSESEQEEEEEGTETRGAAAAVEAVRERRARREAKKANRPFCEVAHWASLPLRPLHQAAM